MQIHSSLTAFWNWNKLKQNQQLPIHSRFIELKTFSPWITLVTLPGLVAPSPPLPQAIPGQTSSFTPLLFDGLIPNLIFSSPKRHDCWTFLAEIFFSELLRVWACACAALGGRGAGARHQWVLQPLQRLLLRLHQREREGDRKLILYFQFTKFGGNSCEREFAQVSYCKVEEISTWGNILKYWHFPEKNCDKAQRW